MSRGQEMVLPEFEAMPVIHMNGTSAGELMEQRAKAIDALHEAGSVLAGMSPNGRDYYPHPGRMERAVALHTKRLGLLSGLIDEITAEYEYLYATNATK